LQTHFALRDALSRNVRDSANYDCEVLPGGMEEDFPLGLSLCVKHFDPIV
jgi:hypothetical protein